MKELILNILEKTNKTIVAYGSEFAERSFTSINTLYMLQRDIYLCISFDIKGVQLMMKFSCSVKCYLYA